MYHNDVRKNKTMENETATPAINEHRLRKKLEPIFCGASKKTSTLVFYQKYSPHFCIHVRIFGLQPKKSGVVYK